MGYGERKRIGTEQRKNVVKNCGITVKPRDPSRVYALNYQSE